MGSTSVAPGARCVRGPRRARWVSAAPAAGQSGVPSTGWRQATFFPRSAVPVPAGPAGRNCPRRSPARGFTAAQ
eukprot:4533417-Lingulodinium_polyedra.AAC.1